MPRSALFRWGVAAAAVVLSVILRFLLQDSLPPGFPYLTFFPAVILTAFVAGVAPGAVTAVVCGFAAWYWFIAPVNSFALTPNSAVALGLYVFVVTTDILLVQAMNLALTRLTSEERRSAELARSRELMFQELQHRVSNNLGVVGSLLSLQRRKVQDETAKAALEVAASRVYLISRMQRMLHDPERQTIAFEGFLRSMADDLVEASGLDGQVEVRVEAEPLDITAAQSVPLALIATEFLANALEHGADGGTVDVRLTALGRDRGELSVTDRGPGLPENFESDGASSLGLSIARQFARQLEAELSIEGDKGVTSRLIFPLRSEA